MNLVEASRVVGPILGSFWGEHDKILIPQIEELKRYFVGFELTNPFKLNQMEIIDSELEDMIEQLVSRYQELTGENLRLLKYS